MCNWKYFLNNPFLSINYNGRDFRKEFSFACSFTQRKPQVFLLESVAQEAKFSLFIKIYVTPSRVAGVHPSPWHPPVSACGYINNVNAKLEAPPKFIKFTNNNYLWLFIEKCEALTSVHPSEILIKEHLKSFHFWYLYYFHRDQKGCC